MTPSLHLAVAHELADTQASVATTFAAVPDFPKFDALSSDLGRTSFNLGAGVDAQLNDTVSLYIDYQARLREHNHEHNGMLGIKVEF